MGIDLIMILTMISRDSYCDLDDNCVPNCHFDFHADSGCDSYAYSHGNSHGIYYSDSPVASYCNYAGDSHGNAWACVHRHYQGKCYSIPHDIDL